MLMAAVRTTRADLAEVRADLHRAEAALADAARSSAVAATLRDFVQWVAVHRAFNGSDHAHGQGLYDECLNVELPTWAEDFIADRIEGGDRG